MDGKLDNDNMFKDVPYAEAMGSVTYIMVRTRPVITYAINIFSRYMMKPSLKHLKAIKVSVKCILGTIDDSLKFCKYSHYVNIIK